MQPLELWDEASMTTKTILNNRAHDLVTEHKIRLRPGENVLSEEKARQVAQSKSGRTWFSLGWLRGKPAPKAATLADDLEAGGDGDGDTLPPGPMLAADAISLAATETDPAVLEGMLDGETRKTVMAAIAKRLATLAGSGDGGGDGGDGEG